MNTVKIEDMPVVEELSNEELAAVQGGFGSQEHASLKPTETLSFPFRQIAYVYTTQGPQ